ncbi:glycosyltransferase family 9 protein [Flagellimonas meishanensis]|uniref:glycosyltransferase family 9 protein n=1 Tax=Flagellimonas meishanensis TaxID=2873264 RepID=UPI0028BDEE24|nr:glycosyltransferase family 9 protein [[Muricauda] meishanensis]
MGKRGKSTHILVIRLSALGDVAMTVPIVRCLTENYPELHLTILTKKHFAPIFSGLERVTVHHVDVKSAHKGFVGLWRLYKTLKALHLDAVADLHNVLRSNVLKRYFTLERIPFAQIDKGRREKKALTRKKDKVFEQLKTTHQRYADVFAELGFPIDLSKAKFLERKRLSEKVVQVVGKDTKKWIGIAPFAAHEGKMYPLDLMKGILKACNGTEKYKILLFGGGEKETQILDELSIGFEHATNVAGSLSLSEELELISNLDVMLSMDSGNAHMAANYGIPVITLWGVTHPYAGFYPFGQPLEHALLADRVQYPLIPTSIYGNKVPKGYEKAMGTIKPERVIEKLFSLLEG